MSDTDVVESEAAESEAAETEAAETEATGSEARRGLTLPARLLIGAVVVAGVVALLWFVIFPWVEGLLPAEF